MSRRAAGKRRVGFLLANIHSGSANAIWPAMAQEAERRDVVLLIFPGGRLHETAEHEHLRNHIFDLAQRGTVDGIVSWASSLCEHLGDEETQRFHARYEGLPVVTLTRKVGDLPSFGIDSYGGMLQLMEHLLDTHGYRRPAFIRGPDPHPPAAERFRAFTDALAARGLECDRLRVSEPCSWSEGRSAALDFLDRRGLHPGRDFDVLVAASDVLLFEACRVFQSRGYTIPGDFAIAGFNDSEESRILWPSFTTVRMPFEKQSVAAFRALLSLIDGTPVESEVRLASSLVVRQSCGCRQDGGDSFVPGARGEGREPLARTIVELLSYDDEERVAWVDPLVAAFFASLESGDPDSFVETLQKILMEVMQTGREIHPWQDALSLLRSAASPGPGGDPNTLIGDLVNRSRIVVSETLRRAHSFRQWHDRQMLRALGDFDRDLLVCRSRDRLGGVLARHLPKLGIDCAFLVTYEPRTAGDGGCARLLSGFRPGAGQAAVQVAETVFPRSSLLPASLLRGLRSGGYIVQPLFLEEEPLGYLVLRAPRAGPTEGSLYEGIRSALSSALKSILLFEEVSRARAAAERAQALKNRFLANVSAELQVPPLEISAACERLAESLARGVSPGAEALLPQLAAIDLLSRRQAGYANDLMDLALSEVDELPLRREIVAPLPLLQEAAAALGALGSRGAIELDSPKRLPLVHWDPQRVRRILEILFERAARTPRAASGATVRVSVTLRVPFVEIRVPHDRLPGQSEEPPGEIAVSLARNLALLHAGSLECEPLGGDGGELWRLRLPLPNLAGSALLTGGRECDPVLVLSSHGRVPEEFDGYQTPSGGGVRLVEPELLLNDLLKDDGAPALVWDLERGDLSEWIVVRSLRLRETLRSIPLLILTAGREIPKSSDLGEFLRTASAARGSGPIVLVDPSGARRGGLATQLREGCGIVELVEIGRVDEIPALLQDVDVGLFILNALDDRDLRFIRDIPRLAAVPILVFVDRLQGLEEIEFCVQAPKVVLCNRHILYPEELRGLIDRLRRGDGSHGPPTSGLVKKAILYLNLHYASVPSRYRLADFVHVNEDYLTRIFRRELGLTPWEYLNRYRIRVAEALLRTTSESIRRIASGAGFRDQAYFCRVFRAITGRSPSEFRERSGSTAG